MDNSELFKKSQKNIEQSLNQRIEYDHMNELMSAGVRTAVDMQQVKDGYDKQHYSVRQTEKDAMAIDTMLHNIETGEFVVSEKEKAKLEALQGRNLSHLMLNDQKFTGDSKEMKEVKTALANLEAAMTRKKKKFTENEAEYLLGLYNTAMEQCQNYIDKKHPKRETGKRRKAMVQATLNRLMKESDAVELGRRIIAEGGSEAKDISSGVELLSLVAVQSFTEKMAHKKSVKEKDELYAEQKLREQQYIADKDVYKELIDNKSEGLGFWQKLQLGNDPEVKKLKEDLKLDEQERKLKDLREKIEELKKKEEEEKKKRSEKKAGKSKAAAENLAQAEEKKEALPANLLVIVNLLSQGTEPTSLIKNKKKIKDSEKGVLKDMLKIFDALKSFKPDTECAKTIRVGGEFVRLCQDEAGNLSLKHKDTLVAFSSNASACMNVISSDVIDNMKLYGDDAVNDIIEETKTDLSQMSRGDLLRTREYTARILHELTGIPMTLFNNVTCEGLKDMALRALAVKDSKDKLKQLSVKMKRSVTSINENAKIQHVNTALNQELQKVGYKQSEGVILQTEKKKDDNGWDEREQKVRNLAADIVFSRDTWNADGLVEDPAERIRRVLNEHAETIGLIISDQFRDKKKEPAGLIENMIEKMPLFSMGEEELTELKKGIATALEEVRDMVKDKLDKALGKGEGIMKAIGEAALHSPALLADHIKKALENLDKEDINKLKQVDKDIDDAVSENMNSIQASFDECVNEIFENNKNDEKKKKDAKVEEGLEKGNRELVESLEKKEKEKGLNEWEKSRLKRLKKGITDRDADKEDGRLAAESTVKLNSYQEQLANVHKEMDDFKLQIAVFTNDMAKAAQNEKKAYEEQIKVLTGAVKKLEDDEKRISEDFKRENKIVNECNKRIRMREVRRRMDKRREEVDLLKEEILKMECENRELEKDKDLPENQNDALREAIDEKIEKNELNLKEYKKSLKNSEKEIIKKTAAELEKILEDSAKGGEKGQSLFMKNVLKNYFKSMPVLDQRSMLSSALRNSRPIPKLDAREREELTSDQKLSFMSDYIGGMFKGAGPLFQKMLQGLPKSSLPKGLRKAVEDTQDSLAPIPDEVVLAHLEGIKERSNKKISRIEVKKSLGAASVGQAFLCRIYGPKMKDGKDVVIKLLRPDVRNRMMREKKVMLDAARLTDEDGKTKSEIEEMRRKGRVGGMEATYLGNLQRIEEELDLTIEAKNCTEGQIYDEALKGKENLCDSMKMSDIVAPTSDTCMMEIAGSKTVKRYMSDMEEKSQEILWKFCVKEKEKDKDGKETGREVLKKNEDGSYQLRKDLTPAEANELESAKKEMGEMLKDAELRTKALAQLVEKWVTQGVFEKGYYHGDLHAGNIMISEKGVTVIDFGNATTLDSEQQKHITKMMVAATMGDVEKFRHGFHLLLENTPEEVYQEKREELTLLFKEVMSMGDEDCPAERIAVALVRAQELGIELPPTIANFSSCQMRLQNTLTDMNNALKAMRNNVKHLNEGVSFVGRYTVQDPVAKLMSDNKDSSAQDKKERIWRRLHERAFVDKEGFREQLKDKPFREDFMKQYGFKVVSDDKQRNEEFKHIDELLKGKKAVTEEEMEYYDVQDIDGVFKVLGGIKENSKDDPVVSGYLNELFSALDILIFEKKNYGKDFEETIRQKKPYFKNGLPSSFDELVSRIKETNNEYKDIELISAVRDMDIKLKTYHDALDKGNASDDQLKQMEDELYDMYKQEHEEEKKKEIEEKRLNDIKEMDKYIPNPDADNNLPPEQLLSLNRSNSMDIMSKAIKTCENNKLNGSELKTEGDKLMKLWDDTTKNIEGYNKNIEAFKKQFAKVMPILWDAQTQMIRELQGSVTDKVKVEDEEPDSFLSIMGGVMNRKKKELLLRLDITTSFKIWWNS